MGLLFPCDLMKVFASFFKKKPLFFLVYECYSARRSCRDQGAGDDFWFAGYDAQVGHGGGVGLFAVLFPVAQGADWDLVAGGEFDLGDAEALADQAGDGGGGLGGGQDRGGIRVGGDFAGDIVVGLGVLRRPVNFIERFCDQVGGDRVKGDGSGIRFE